MSVGFIRDKLEIKFLILYVAAGVSNTMPCARSLLQSIARFRAQSAS